MKKISKVAIAASLAAALVLSMGARRSESRGPELSGEDVKLIIKQAEESANRVASLEGLRTNSDAARGPVVKRPTKMIIAVVDRRGKVEGVFGMPDAWVGSEDIAVAKARTAAFFSSDENALTSRIIGELSQPSKPDGTGAAGPLWGIGNSNQQGGSGSKETRNGLITFPGGVALYKEGKLVGGIGVSGDGVDQDESVAFAGAAGFEPGPNTVKLGYKAPTVTAIEQ